MTADLFPVRAVATVDAAIRDAQDKARAAYLQLFTLYPTWCGHSICRDDDGVPIACIVRDEMQ